MASSSCVTQITINFHYGGVFEANPDFGMLKKLKNVDLISMDYSQVVSYLETQSRSICKGLYFLVPGTNVEGGLRSLKNDDGVRNCRQYALRNNGEIDIYMVHSEFSEHIGADSDVSESEEDDYEVYSVESSDNDDTASLDHLSNGEDEVVQVRTQKTAPKTKKKPTKMFDDKFLARLFNGIEREKYIEKEVGPDDEFNVEDHDKLGDHWPIHNPNTKWKFMRPVLGERFEDHYAKLWSYAQEIMTSNPGSTCSMDVNPMPDGKTYFKCFYVCFKGLKQGWLEGCRRVIGKHFGEGLTIISDQHKGLIEAAKEVMPFAEHRQSARHIYANFRKKFTGVLYRNLFWKAAKASYPAKFQEVMNEIKDLSKDAYQHLMDRQPKSWSRAFFETDRVCDAVENGISECFNSLIVDARKKPIINMLEDIRIYIMERQKRMRDKHVLWSDEICPNIRKKVEIIKDKDKHRQWQLTGIPCAHGCAAIYFLHKDPDKYVSDWYRKSMFVSVYQHFIHPLDGMDQWAPTEYQNPLPPVITRMPGKRRTKRRKDASEGNDKNRTRVSRVGRVIHCTNCHQEGHNRKGCKSSVPIQTEDGGNAGTQAANGGVGRTKYMIRRGGSSAGRGCSSS
ncbi:hypothetical protein Tco_1375234 [Tanacetum coccineum]